MRLQRWQPRTYRRVGIALIVFAAMSVALTVDELIDARTRSRWVETAGVVSSVSPTEATKDVIVVYRYRADQQELEGRERRRKRSDVTPGAAVAVRYDPTHPTQSTLRSVFAEWFTVGFATVTAAALAAAGSWARRAGRERDGAR
ncbi:MAG: DUF3592 domain-containing protein [Candidatus Rokubacteria bacterium]|nr:DUF3592 domain-containing protein [Candidatus Rokubacteria bacterium]